VDGGRQGNKRRVGAARRRSRGHGPARLDGTRPRATVASKVMESGKMAGQGNGPFQRRPHGKRKRAGPKLEAGPEASAEQREGTMEARRGRDAVGGSMRYAHDSATGHVSWPGTHGPQCGTSNWISLNSCSIYGEAGSASTAATFAGGSATQEQSQKTRRCFAIQLQCINV